MKFGISGQGLHFARQLCHGSQGLHFARQLCQEGQNDCSLLLYPTTQHVFQNLGGTIAQLQLL